ncbi:hypothetical protein J6393_31005, partial [Pseudomonas aeruginosa]|nr:hypothetical protein [Pseudomonas aeruginosa]
PAPAAEPAEEPATELPATHPSSRAKAALKKIKDNPDAPESLFDEAVAGKHGPAARKKANEFSAQMGAKPYAAYAYAKHLRDNPDLIAPAEEKTAAAPPPKAAPTGSLVERAQGAKGLDAYDLFAEALAGKHGA